MFDKLRKDWEDPSIPVTGPAFRPNRVTHVALHYTADKKIPANTAKYLANIQSAYTRSRGYSIGYNAAVDKNGVVWELVDSRTSALRIKKQTTTRSQFFVSLTVQIQRIKA